MNRRQFLVGGAAACAVVAGTANTASAQAPAGGGRGRGGGGRGANIPAEKLARIALMTLNFNAQLKLPWAAGSPRPTQTVDLLDLPQYYMDQYRVPNMEFQTDHLAPDPERSLPDGEFFREMRARLDAAGVAASQINLEIGGMGNLDGDARQAWLTRARRWVDLSPILGVTRLMVIQDGLAEETKANCIATWKPLADYARPRGIRVSAETRGGGGGRRGGPPPVTPARPAWMLLEEVIEASGGYSNVDLGGAGATSQQELHDCIKGMYHTSSGNMHIKSSPYWDIGLAIDYTESLGYTGLYSIEVNPDAAIRIVYNTIVANL